MRLSIVTSFLIGGGCVGGASATFQLSNDTATARTTEHAAGTSSLRLKIIAAYLAEDVDPITMNNIGDNAMIWINPQCGGEIDGCNVDGFTLPAGPRITDYFDLSRTSDEINADLNAQATAIPPGSYRYARLELCKAFGGESQASIPTMMWRGPDMAADQPFTSGDCGRTSLAFDPPLVLAAGDTVAITLGYDLGAAVVGGTPTPNNPGSIVGATESDGSAHVFRACTDVDADHRDCMDFPDFAPSATKQ